MMIIVFFIFCTLSTFISGLFLPRLHKTPTTQSTGRALMLTGVAFAIWSVAVMIKPEQSVLNFWISGGAALFIVALVFFTKAAVSKLAPTHRQVLITVGAVYAVVLWFIRMTLPSHPGFSEKGLFFFQPHDVVKFMYVVLMMGVILPAIQQTADDIRSKDVFTARMFTGAMIANLIGGILLLVSVMDVQDTLMYLVGWGMGIAQLFLLLSCLGIFHKTKLTTT